MDIKIGIRHINREVALDVNEGADDIQRQFNEALESRGILRLTETKGRVVLIPAESIGYIDCGQDSSRPVGFGSV